MFFDYPRAISSDFFLQLEKKIERDLIPFLSLFTLKCNFRKYNLMDHDNHKAMKIMNLTTTAFAQRCILCSNTILKVSTSTEHKLTHLLPRRQSYFSAIRLRLSQIPGHKRTIRKEFANRELWRHILMSRLKS